MFQYNIFGMFWDHLRLPADVNDGNVMDCELLQPGLKITT